MDDDARERIDAIVRSVLKAPDDIELTSDTEFRSLPNADSMNILQIILETETAFDIEIDDNVTFHVETLGEYYRVVEELCGQSAPA